jgi:hypothetical protein
MFGLPPMLAHLVELAVLLLLTLVALGVGARLLDLLRIAKHVSAGERALFGTALGYGVFGFSMLALGLVGLISLPSGLVLLAFLVALGSGPLLRELPILRQAIRGYMNYFRYPPVAVLAAIIGLSIAAALVKALAPVATQDDLMYHLALPERYIASGAVLFYPDSTYSLFPQLMEMLYTWGLLLGSDRLAVLFALGVSLLGPLAAGLYAHRYLAQGRGGSWLALGPLTVALYLTVPLVGYVLRAANTDLAQASFDLLAMYAVWLSFSHRMGDRDGVKQTDRRHGAIACRFLLLAGLFSGLSFSTKYYGFAAMLLLGVAALYIGYKLGSESGAQPVMSVVKAGAAFALGALLLAAPWLVRNTAEAGNPVWPLAGGLFGGSYTSHQPELAPETLLGRPPSLGIGSLWSGLTYIWSSATRPPLTIDAQRHDVNLGYLLLPALLTLPFARLRAPALLALYTCLGYWILWALLFSRTSARYLSTFLLIAALLGAYGLVSLTLRSKWLTRATGIVVTLLLLWMTLFSVYRAAPHAGAVFALDQAAEEAYLRRYMADYRVMRYIGESVPANARLYIWDGQPRGYYVNREYIYARLVPLYSKFGQAPEEWRERLRELGITHVLYHRRAVLAPGQRPGQDPFAGVSRSFIDRYFGPALIRVGSYTLHELK